MHSGQRARHLITFRSTGQRRLTLASLASHSGYDGTTRSWRRRHGSPDRRSRRTIRWRAGISNGNWSLMVAGAHHDWTATRRHLSPRPTISQHQRTYPVWARRQEIHADVSKEIADEYLHTLTSADTRGGLSEVDPQTRDIPCAFTARNPPPAAAPATSNVLNPKRTQFAILGDLVRLRRAEQPSPVRSASQRPVRGAWQLEMQIRFAPKQSNHCTPKIRGSVLHHSPRASWPLGSYRLGSGC